MNRKVTLIRQRTINGQYRPKNIALDSRALIAYMGNGAIRISFDSDNGEAFDLILDQETVDAIRNS